MGKQKKGNEKHYNKISEYMYRKTEEEYLHARQELNVLLKIMAILMFSTLILCILYSIF